MGGRLVCRWAGSERYLEVHEVHELGDLWLQHLHGLLVDLHAVGLLVTLHLAEGDEGEEVIKHWTD